MLLTIEVEFETDWEEELCDFGLEPGDFSTKQELSDRVSDIIGKDWWDITHWDMKYGSDVHTRCTVSDEEWERFKQIEPNPFDVWATAVRESRERRAKR